MHYGKVDDFNIKITKNDAFIKLPDSCKYDLGWFQAKYRVVTDLREYAKINNVQFVEEYLKKTESAKDDKGKKRPNKIKRRKINLKGKIQKMYLK
jgi:hypothetical protein